MTLEVPSPSTISHRARLNIEQNDFIKIIFEILKNLYDRETNPNGVVNLGVAENSLMHDELVEFTNKHFKLTAEDCGYGQGPAGSERLRDGMANLVNDYFNPWEKVHADDIAVASGVTSVSDIVSWAVADEGEGFLIGQPFYGAFINDLTARSRTRPIPVPFGFVDPFSEEAIACYEAKLKECTAMRVQIRGVILCSPHNPLGRCYPTATLKKLCQFCQQYQIHLISDEIYALSVFKTAENADAPGFTSILALDTEGLIDKDLVHCLYGMSKDFNANGFRIGALITRNTKLLEAARGVGMFSWASPLADIASANILHDREFLDKFIVTNRQRLGKSYEYAKAVLNKHKIKHSEGNNAGLFIWLDLRHALPKDETDGTKAEQQLFGRLIDGGVYAASGLSFGSETPGWFRIIFSLDRHLLDVGISRIAKVVHRQVVSAVDSP